jgi:DNA-binding PadR family transcriptional regulator
MSAVVLEQEKEAGERGSTSARKRGRSNSRKSGEAKSRARMKREGNAEAPSSARHVEKSKGPVRARQKASLTTPDLVLLSLLAERPMHGYQANLELERREVRDWAGISRPQVYYSLEKLARAGMIRGLESGEPAAGPERSTYETTAKGRAALADALEREEWATQRDRPPFLTWMALSWQARPGVLQNQIRRRRQFLEQELAREKEVLRSILEEVGHPYHEALWMVSFVLDQFKIELRWLAKLEREVPRRAPARHPDYGSE